MADVPHGRELELLDPEQVNTLGIVADNMGKSGLFPDAKTGQAAFAKIMLGRSLGLGAAQAMTGIHVVKGKPQIAATTLAGFVRESQRYDYRILRHDDEACVIEFGFGDAPRSRATSLTIGGDDDPPIGSFDYEVEPAWETAIGISIFTVEEAQHAELGGYDASEADGGDAWRKSQWGKYPRNMVFARAMSNGVKWYCPDLFGGVPVYTEGDEFAERESVGRGDGDGEPRGVPLVPEVEAVLARAASLGHVALSDRASAEIALDGQTEGVIARWVADAELALDEMAEVIDADAEVLPADDDAAGWRERSATFLAAWQALAPEEQETESGRILKHEADTALHRAMNIGEGGGVEATVVKREGGETDGRVQ